MVRTISVILLIALLPRMLVAATQSNTICISGGHVAVACHANGAADDCSDAADDCGNDSDQDQWSRSDEGTCLDLIADSIEAVTNPPRASVEVVAAADAFCELIETALLTVSPAAASWGEPAGNLPPRFCARTFACLLSPRC